MVAMRPFAKLLCRNTLVTVVVVAAAAVIECNYNNTNTVSCMHSAANEWTGVNQTGLC